MDDERDINPLPEDQPPPAGDSRADEQASDAEIIDALTQGGTDTDEFAADGQRLQEMIGAAEEPPPAASADAPEIRNESLGEEPERPATTAHDFEDDAKALDDLAGPRDLESFGKDLNAFHDAGGADNAIPDVGDDGSDDSHDATEQLNDADFSFKSRVSDMLIEHARRTDELTRGLEAERL